MKIRYQNIARNIRLHFICSRIILLLVLLLNISCKKESHTQPPAITSPDIAIAWMKMQNRLLVGTPGIFPHVAGRAYAYTGLALYESIVPGMEGYQSIAAQLSEGLTLPVTKQGEKYNWQVSASAALAFINKNLFPQTTPALIQSVDSLEATIYNGFKHKADAAELQRSADFGRQVAQAIFEWSKTDGAHEAYKNPFSDSYVLPTGPGKWLPTDTIFLKPIYPFWGDNRTFIPGIADATQPPPPPAYAETPGSDFYNAVNEIYTMSQHLTREDSLTARFWAYDLLIAGDELIFDDVSHAANMVTQMIVLKKLSLQDATLLYCKHAMAVNEAGISCVKTKFEYCLVRPANYIRDVLGHSDWNPVIFTPPFPEYTSAHAAISMACAIVLENTFGKNFPFTDYSFENTYGARSFTSFEAYAKEAALSRLQGGIHYRFSMEKGLEQGREVAEMVCSLKFKK